MHSPLYKYLLFLWIFPFAAYGAGQTDKPLPIKEAIVGVSPSCKKALKKYAFQQIYSNFLGIPIKKWLYQLGVQQFNAEKIKKDIAAIRDRYACKLAKLTSEKEKTKLIAKRDKLLKRKENLCLYGNWLMRKGEKPVEHNMRYVHHTEKMFLSYLHGRGYLDAEVYSKTDFQDKKRSIVYFVKQNALYKISALNLNTPHQEIRAILAKHAEASFLKQGTPYSYQNLLNEQERIITLLSDNGYFSCNEEHVTFGVKVSPEDHKVNITTLVDRLDERMPHLKQTRIARIVVNCTTASNNQDCSITYFHGIKFVSDSCKYPLEHLVRKIAIRSGDWYSKRKILETYERLHAIALFESIVILPKMEGEHLVVYIYVKPYERCKLQVDFGLECFNLNLKRLRPTIKLLPTIKPVFGGLGNLQIESSIALWDRQGAANKYYFFDYGTYAWRCRCLIPRFVWNLSDKTHLLLEAFSPKTTMSIGYDFLKNPLFHRHKMDATIAYDWCNRTKHVSYQFIPCSILLSIWDHYKGNNSVGSIHFVPELCPYFLTTIGWICKIVDPFPDVILFALEEYRWMLSIGIEHGGLYEYLFAIRKCLSNMFHCYQYLKFDITYRHAFRLSQDMKLVYQTQLGSILAYGGGEMEVHPDKQYAIGGHGSVRAWDRQCIGPGSYERRQTQRQEESAQKGDLLLLGNVELRQKLIGYLEGALFVDIGNIWKFSRHALPAMQFDFSKFYKELAIGVGFGLRVNVYNTFVLCGDLAIPLHRPSGIKLNGPSPFNFNLSIDYPF